MTTMDGLIRTVLEWVEKEGGIPDASYTTSFVAGRLPNPLTKPRVAVGLEEVRMSAGALGQVLMDESYGSRADVALKIKIYMPESRGGDALNEIFSRICTVLMTSGRGIGIHSVSCGEIRYETGAMAYTIDCRAELTTYIGEYDSERPLEGVVIKGKGE